MGSLSIWVLKSANKFFRPLIPDVDFIFNNEADLAKITTRTAGIVLETIQGGAILFNHIMIFKSSARCTEVGALMILDEIQPVLGERENFLIPEL
jgi:acetylornithine/succinyldiaminopimelate/putrescine aminotransferase